MVIAKMSALITLKTKLEEMEEYGTNLADGNIKKRNHESVSNIVTVFEFAAKLECRGACQSYTGKNKRYTHGHLSQLPHSECYCTS